MNTEIEIKSNGKYLTLQCIKGHKITDWQEGDNIEDFHDFTIAYVPLNCNTEKFRCITDEESERLIKLRDEAIEEKHRKEEEELDKIENE